LEGVGLKQSLGRALYPRCQLGLIYHGRLICFIVSVQSYFAACLRGDDFSAALIRNDRCAVRVIDGESGTASTDVDSLSIIHTTSEYFLFLRDLLGIYYGRGADHALYE
jgi:hypothetical protein